MSGTPVTVYDTALNGITIPRIGDYQVWDAAGNVVEPKFRAFAEGGIVTELTTGLVGEAGDEAVITLSRLDASGGTTINVTVNVMGNTMLGRDQATARELVSILKPELERIISY